MMKLLSGVAKHSSTVHKNQFVWLLNNLCIKHQRWKETAQRLTSAVVSSTTESLVLFSSRKKTVNGGIQLIMVKLFALLQLQDLQTNVWFQQDGTLLHWSTDVRAHLEKIFQIDYRLDDRFVLFKKQYSKITQLEKMRFIVVTVGLFQFFHFMCVAANASELFCMVHLANIERFLYHSNLSF